MVLEGPSYQLPQVVALPRLFESAVLSHPSSPALKDAHPEATWITFGDLNQRANALARSLLKHLRKNPDCSNPDGDRVIAVCMPQSSQMVTTLLAIHKAGGSYLPLDVTSPESRVAQILKDSRPALVLVHGKPKVFQSTANGFEGVPILELEELQKEILQESGENLTEVEVGISVKSDTIMSILYTSGSTGIPKGVRVPHRAAFNRLAWQWNHFPYDKNEVCCFKTALTFVDSISEMFGPLLTGHKVVVVPKLTTQAVDEFVSVLEREKVGRLVLVPSLLRTILIHCSNSETKTTLKNLRLWVCSGEVLSSDLLDSFFEIFTDGQTICNFYGSTEVMGDVSYIQFQNNQEAARKIIDKKVPIGLPIHNTQIFLLNDEGKEVTDGQMGEIFVAGLNVTSGYVGGAQSDKFIANEFPNNSNYPVLYRTGDFGRVVNGMVVFEGRTDSQIKVRGHRVDMNEVQTAVQKVPGVDKVYVLCYKPGEIDQELVAFYTTPSDNLPPQELKLQLDLRIHTYMQPKLIRVDDLPLLVNGKVDRHQLLETFKRKSGGDQQKTPIDLAGVPPEQKESAKALLQTIGKVLGPSISETLSIKSNFFHIGGNSLNAVLAVTTLNDLGYSVGISQFLKADNLEEVLSQMKRIKNYEGIQNTAIDCSNSVKYKREVLSTNHIESVIRFLSEGFANKGRIETLLGIEAWEYIEPLTPMMTIAVEQGLSFVLVRSGSDEVVAVALNFDLDYDLPLEDLPLTPNLQCLLVYVESCEGPAKIKIPGDIRPILQCFAVATSPELGPVENVEIIQIVEAENLKFAQMKGYKAVFTTNTAELTQHICEDLLNYEVLGSYQINQWEAPDGSKPFGVAPNSQHIITVVKYL